MPGRIITFVLGMLLGMNALAGLALDIYAAVIADCMLLTTIMIERIV